MRVIFSKTAVKQYRQWEVANPKTAVKIDELIGDIVKNGLLDGIGKPEQLKHYKNPPRFSRRITQADRLVYATADDEELVILSCKSHYADN